MRDLAYKALQAKENFSMLHNSFIKYCIVVLIVMMAFGTQAKKKEKVKVEGKKRPQLMDVDHTFEMDKVKYTKYLISFK